jgi:hypothetical protein
MADPVSSTRFGHANAARALALPESPIAATNVTPARPEAANSENRSRAPKRRLRRAASRYQRAHQQQVLEQQVPQRSPALSASNRVLPLVQLANSPVRRLLRHPKTVVQLPCRCQTRRQSTSLWERHYRNVPGQYRPAAFVIQGSDPQAEHSGPQEATPDLPQRDLFQLEPPSRCSSARQEQPAVRAGRLGRQRLPTRVQSWASSQLCRQETEHPRAPTLSPVERPQWRPH